MEFRETAVGGEDTAGVIRMRRRGGERVIVEWGKGGREVGNGGECTIKLKGWEHGQW